MGNLATSIYRKSIKPLRNYNLESRIEKVLEKEKPIAAPHHPTVGEPGLPQEERESLHKTDSEFSTRLKDVYVTSKKLEEGEIVTSKSSKRNLPTSRNFHEEPEYGYAITKKRTYGKISLKDALDILTKHHQSPEDWPAKKIADEYNLDVARVENILKYFAPFVLVVPPKVDEKSRDQTDWENLSKSVGAQSVYELKALPSDKPKS